MDYKRGNRVEVRYRSAWRAGTVYHAAQGEVRVALDRSETNLTLTLPLEAPRLRLAEVQSTPGRVSLIAGVEYGLLDDGQVRSGHSVLPTAYVRKMHKTLAAFGEPVPEGAEVGDQWSYRGERGVESSPRNCELCGCLKVLYWFRIHNDLNGHTLVIGSECIQHFNNPFLTRAVNEDKKAMQKAEGLRRRKDEVERAALNSPWVRENKGDFLARLDKYGRLTPKVEKIIKSILVKAK